MVNYADGKIYKITCNTTGLCYIGSTCGTLTKRLNGHVRHYKLFLNGKYQFVTSFKVIENNNYIIESVELVLCDDKTELYKRERFHIENTICVNKIIVGRSKVEYRVDNKNKLNDRTKLYNANNKDKIIEYNRLRYLKLKTLKLVINAIVAI